MPLNDEDKAAIGELIKSSLTAFGTKLDEKFVTADAATKMVEQGTAKALEGLDLDSKLNGLVEKLKPAGGGDGGSKGGKGDAGGDGKPDPEVAKLQERLEQMERQNREAQDQAAAAEKRAREQSLDNAMRSHLAAAGIPADKHDLAIPVLRTEDGKPVVDLNDNGQPIYRQQKKGYVDEMAMADGLKGWASTEAGKTYIPATGANGTGDGTGGRQPQGGGSVPRTESGQVDWGSFSGRMNTAALRS